MTIHEYIQEFYPDYLDLGQGDAGVVRHPVHGTSVNLDDGDWYIRFYSSSKKGGHKALIYYPYELTKQSFTPLTPDRDDT